MTGRTCRTPGNVCLSTKAFDAVAALTFAFGPATCRPSQPGTSLNRWTGTATGTSRRASRQSYHHQSADRRAQVYTAICHDSSPSRQLNSQPRTTCRQRRKLSSSRDVDNRKDTAVDKPMGKYEQLVRLTEGRQTSGMRADKVFPMKDSYTVKLDVWSDPFARRRARQARRSEETALEGHAETREPTQTLQGEGDKQAAKELDKKQFPTTTIFDGLDGYEYTQRPGDNANSSQTGRTEWQKKARGRESKVPKPQELWKSKLLRLSNYAKETHNVDPANVSIDARKILDYEGKVVPSLRASEKDTVGPPWALTDSERSGLSALEVLDGEISRFARFISLTEEEKRARNLVGARVVKLVQLVQSDPAKYQEKNRDLSAYPFGSQKSGLALAFSDIDICVVEVKDGKAHHGTAQVGERMQALHRYLDFGKEFVLVVLRTGRFPIISCQHRDSGLDVQIFAGHSTKPQQTQTASLLEEFPHLRSVYAVFRTLLGMRGLDDVWTGGTGSYGAFIMLAASLARRRSSPLPPTPAGQLLHFLDFYCDDFDTTRHAISLPARKVFLKHDPTDDLMLHKRKTATLARRRGDHLRMGQWHMAARRPLQPYLLCLQDGASLVNDLGRKTSAIRHVLCTMRELRDELKRSMRMMDGGEWMGDRGRRRSLLLPLVGDCHLVYRARRRKVEEWAARVSGSKKGVHGGGGDVEGATLAETSPKTSPLTSTSIRNPKEQKVVLESDRPLFLS